MQETKIKSTFPIPRLKDETPKAYEAFKQYCFLGSDRSIHKAGLVADGKISRDQAVSRKNDPANSSWNVWSKRFNWVKRAAEYDEWIAKSDVKTIREERDENIKILHSRSREMFEISDEVGQLLLQAMSKAVKKRFLQKDENGKEPKPLEAAEAQKWGSAFQSICAGNKLVRESFTELLGLEAIAKIAEKDSTN